MNILISVIVPVYNVELYLDRCISSIINQKYKQIEVLLIDDGSTDSSLDICRYWEQRDNRITVIHQKNAGVSAARNVGIDHSNGQYISFIDSDDIVDENIYSEFEEQYKKGIDIIRFRCKTLYGKFRVVSENLVEGELNLNSSIDKYNLFFNGHTFGSVCFTIFKKNIISNHRFNSNYKYGEDYLFYFNVLENVSTIYISNKILYYYMINYFSATRRKDITKELKEIKDHFNVDFEVTNFIRLNKFNSLIDDALDCTVNATNNWLRNLAKNYTYKQFRSLITELIESEEYKSYIIRSDVIHKNCMINLVESTGKWFFIREKFIGLIKKTIKKILYK